MTIRISTTSASSIPVKRKAPLFSLGAVVATRAVLEHLDKHGINAQEYLDRHACCDWGDVPPEDARENQIAVEQGFRIMSSYEIAGQRVWVITDAATGKSTVRESTCILFPQEY